MQHPELGRKILDQVAEAVTAVAKIEAYPRLDGRNMTMVLGPDKKAQAAAEKRRSADDSGTPVASTPMTPEATYYRLLFRKFFGVKRDDIISHYWQPKWDKDGKVIEGYVDPSARTLDVY